MTTTHARLQYYDNFLSTPYQGNKWSDDNWWLKAKCGMLELPSNTEDNGPDKCLGCGEKLSLQHIILQCPKNPIDTEEWLEDARIELLEDLERENSNDITEAEINDEGRGTVIDQHTEEIEIDITAQNNRDVALRGESSTIQNDTKSNKICQFWLAQNRTQPEREKFGKFVRKTWNTWNTQFPLWSNRSKRATNVNGGENEQNAVQNPIEPITIIDEGRVDGNAHADGIRTDDDGPPIAPESGEDQKNTLAGTD